MDDLSVAKRKLFSCLGDNLKSYLQLLKTWFKNNLTKDDFDQEARKLLDAKSIKKHNAFLLALFSRCQDLTSIDSQLDRKASPSDPEIRSRSPKLAKPIKRHIMKKCENRFMPANPLDYTPTPKRIKMHQDNALCAFKLAVSSGEGLLPDHFMANFRMLVIVWEFGLDNLTNETVMILNYAIRDFIKNIIMSVLTFKSSFRTYGKDELRYAVGVPSVNPYLRNPCPKHQELKEDEAVYQIACANFDRRRAASEHIVNLWQLYYTLKLNKSVIPSHSVYAINMEKIITRLSDKKSEEELTGL